MGAYILLIMLIIYFLVLRPQKRKEKQRKDLIGNLKKNDRVLTTGGIIGVFVSRSEREVVLKIDMDENVRVRFSPSAITEVIRSEETAEQGKPS